MSEPDPMAALKDTLRRVAEAAPTRDRDGDGLNAEIGWLHEAGALAEALPAALTGVSGWSDDPLAVAARLREIGRASLPVGRLFEGHVNAAQLIGLYGEPTIQKEIVAAVNDGALLGVWGANGGAPLRAERSAGGGFVLSGDKIFCSGLGLVRWALVSAALDGQTALFSVRVDDGARMKEDQWNVSGMRATRSGGYDFNDVRVPPTALVGGLDAYFREPYFLGGMYRFCAVQAGGLHALLDEMVVVHQRRGQGQNPLVQYRIGFVATALNMAGAVTEDLARRVSERIDPAEIARTAILTREGVERCIVQCLEIAERSLGTEMHREPARLSMLRRDLSFYIRQAAVDERLTNAGRDLLQS